MRLRNGRRYEDDRVNELNNFLLGLGGLTAYQIVSRAAQGGNEIGRRILGVGSAPQVTTPGGSQSFQTPISNRNPFLRAQTAAVNLRRRSVSSTSPVVAINSRVRRSSGPPFVRQTIGGTFSRPRTRRFRGRYKRSRRF